MKKLALIIGLIVFSIPSLAAVPEKETWCGAKIEQLFKEAKEEKDKLQKELNRLEAEKNEVRLNIVAGMYFGVALVERQASAYKESKCK